MLEFCEPVGVGFWCGASGVLSRGSLLDDLFDVGDLVVKMADLAGRLLGLESQVRSLLVELFELGVGLDQGFEAGLGLGDFAAVQVGESVADPLAHGGVGERC